MAKAGEVTGGGFEVVSNEAYTGMSSDEKNRTYGLDGWPCTHEPPHGIALPKERKFVITRHFPDEAGLQVLMPINLDRSPRR